MAVVGLEASWQPLENTADDVLVAIRARLNASQMRTIDLFRKIDTSGDGSASIKEFRAGLSDLGFACSDNELSSVASRLDKDGSGEITLKELDRALKKAEKHATPRGRATITGGRATLMGGTLSEFAETPRHGRKSLVRKSETGPVLAEKYGAMRKQESLPPMDRADEVLCKIKGSLNARKTRMIDVFRVIDESGDGTVSADEFRIGLAKLGFETSDDDFEAVMVALDKDGSGDVSVKEFDKALKLAEKKARAEGRDDEVDTFHGAHKVHFDHESRPYDWSRRSLKTDGHMSFMSVATCGSELATPRDPNATTSTFSTGSQKLRPLDTGGCWRSAAAGPLIAALSARVGSGSVHDSSVPRQRVLDIGPAIKPLAPSLRSPALPTYKTVEHVVRYSSRFGAFPVDIQHDSMHRKRHRCAVAERSTLQLDMVAGTKKFPNTPMMQSTVDQVVFGRDMDMSGEEKFDEDFIKMFEGSYGQPSWHWGR